MDKMEQNGFEPTEKAQLIVCGAGHITLPLMELAKKVGFEITLLDDRQDEIAEKIAVADRFIKVNDYEGDIKALEVPSDAFYVINTQGHQHDLEALAGVLAKSFKYVGMVGNHVKRPMIRETMIEKGIDPNKVDSIFMPIGLDIGGETGNEIAVSAVAEIMCARYGKAGGPLSEKFK